MHLAVVATYAPFGHVTNASRPCLNYMQSEWSYNSFKLTQPPSTMEKVTKSVEILEKELATLKGALDQIQPSPVAVKQEYPHTPGTITKSDLQEEYDKLILSNAKLVKLRKGDIKSVNLWKDALQDHKAKFSKVNKECERLKEENLSLQAEVKRLKEKAQAEARDSRATSRPNTAGYQSSFLTSNATCPESDGISTDQIRAEAAARLETVRERISSSPPPQVDTKTLLIKDSIDLDAFSSDKSSPSVAREIDPDLEHGTNRHEGVVFKEPKSASSGLMKWLKVNDDDRGPASSSSSKKRAIETIDLDSQGSPKQKNKQRTAAEAAPVDNMGPASYQLNDFVINPAYNGDLDYAYAETVRGSKRQCEHGGECRQCDEFYKMAGPGLVSAAPQWAISSNGDAVDERGRKLGMEETINASSRHRNRWKRAPSPPGFWRSDFPNTQEVAEEKRLAEETRRKEVEARYKSATAGGKWMFREHQKKTKKERGRK